MCFLFCKIEKRFKACFPFWKTLLKYVSSSEGDPKLSFKKRALDAGIEKSNHDILLFTDVDCQLGKYWVSSMAENFDKNTDDDSAEDTATGVEPEEIKPDQPEEEVSEVSGDE